MKRDLSSRLVFAVAAASGMPLVACEHARESPGKTLTAVRVHAVERASGATAARYSATIKPESQVDVAFKLGGYVRDIAKTKGIDGHTRLLQEGDWVDKGTELAWIRESDFSQKLSEAKAGLAEAMAAKSQAQLDFERITKLAASGSVAAQELDNAKVRLDAALARVDAAAARVQQAQQAVADTVIRAPMEGVVLKRTIEVGSLAGPGTIAFVLADTRAMKVAFGVPDTVLETLKVGSAQTITTEASPGVRFEGHITRIAPWADPKSRVFEVETTIPNPKGELKTGMVASLKLSDSAPASTLTVLPLSAIVRAPSDDKAFAVFVVDEKSTPPLVRLRRVDLGEFLGNAIPVKSGLADGEKVVVMGATLVSDGEPVRVIP